MPLFLPIHDTTRRAHKVGGTRFDRLRNMELGSYGSRFPDKKILANQRFHGSNS